MKIVRNVHDCDKEGDPDVDLGFGEIVDICLELLELLELLVFSNMRNLNI